LPSLFYRIRTDGFTTLTQALNDSTFLQTEANLGRDRTGGFESIVTVSLGRRLEANVTGSLYYEQIDASNLGLPGLRSVFSGGGAGNLSFAPWRRTQFELNPQWKSPKLSPQGTQRSSFVLNVGARQNFLGDRISLTLAVSDLLKTQSQDTNLDIAGIHQVLTNRRDRRNVYVGMGYHFGVAQKHKDKSIEYQS